MRMDTVWRQDGDALVRDAKLEDRATGLASVDRVGEPAGAANHRPAIPRSQGGSTASTASAATMARSPR
jgi:pterin-4a-carbinolamine dehydratase